MSRHLIHTPQVMTIVRSLSPQIKKKIRMGMDEIVRNPHSGKPLVNELEGFWSYRIQRYRIIYQFDSTEITFLLIGPRSSVYRDVMAMRSRKN